MRVTKKLITVLEIKNLAAEGKKELYLEPGTIITPAAKDEAAQRGIMLRTQRPAEPEPNLPTSLKQLQATGSINSSLVEEIVKQVLLALPEFQPRKLAKETDPSGMVFIEEICCSNRRVQEILSKEESPKLGCGFLTLDGESFTKSAEWDEINYILEGTVTASVNDRSYQRKAGDVIYIPKGTKLILNAKRKAQIFYVVNRCC